MAFVRIGQIIAKGDLIQDLRRIYEAEAIPSIRSAPGNISAVLLQQHQSQDKFMAMTIWKTKEDADNYDKSGHASQIIGKVKHTFATAPTLVTYEAYGIPTEAQ